MGRNAKRWDPGNDGWTRVYMKVPFSREMSAWSYEHCTDAVYGGRNWDVDSNNQVAYVVECVNPEDATLFALRWLS